MKILGGFFILFLGISSAWAAIDPQDLIAGPLRRFIDPAPFGVTEYRLESLPLEGSLASEKVYGYQWYSLMGGLRFRGFTSGASPAEKLDEILGTRGTDHSIVRLERKKMGNVLFPWTGLCNSVADLHLALELPDHAVEAIGKNGNRVWLEPQDLHGIVAYALKPQVETAPILGLRCENGFGERKFCKGLNPASFHLMLAEHLGKKHDGLIIDADRFAAVNNLPVYSYRSVVSRIAADQDRDGHPLDVYQVDTLLELPVTVHPWSPSITTHESRLEIYRYKLYIDPMTGKILGGHWLSRARPDFAWLPVCKKFEGDLAWLNALVKWKCRAE